MLQTHALLEHRSRRLIVRAPLAALLALIIAPAIAAEPAGLARVDASALEHLPADARVIEQHGDVVWISGPAASLSRLPNATLIDGGYALALPGLRATDPLFSAPGASPERATDPRPTLALVQFHASTRAQWLAQLEADEITPLQYLHPFTYVVWAAAQDLSRAMDRGSAIRWVGLYPDTAKVQLRNRVVFGTPSRYRLMVARVARLDTAAIAALVTTLEDRTVIDLAFEEIVVVAAAESLVQLAQLPGVLSIQDFATDGGSRGELSNQQFAGNVDASNQPQANYPNWLAQFSLNGQGVRIANVDSGINENHPDLAARMRPCTGVSCGGAASQHGTHTAAIMAGDGASGVRDSRGFLRGLGVAPAAELIEQSYSPIFQQAGGMLTLMQVSAANGALLSGNSWGPAGAPRGYDANTRQVDVGTRDTDPNVAGDQPLLYVLSIMNGNGGTSSQGTPDEAKNTLTVGSTQSQNSSSGAPLTNWQSISANSGHGPALDGRSIPHLVAPGCSVDSASSGTGYALLCGTSMASPHVSGAAALVIQGYRARHAGANPSPALLKAHLVANTRDLFGGTDANGLALTRRPNSRQGWGALRLDDVLRAMDRSWWHDQSRVFTATGQSWEIELEPRDPTAPLRVMLTWTDAPGPGTCNSATCTTPSWANDLDLEVTQRSQTWRGNVFGSDGWSTTGGSSDPRNNLDGVMLPARSVDGPFTLRVRATNIVADALPNSPGALQQDFALVCVNCRLPAPANPDLIFANSFGD